MSGVHENWNIVGQHERRIAELEAALYAALGGMEVVVHGPAPGELERKVMEDGSIMWRRKHVQR